MEERPKCPPDCQCGRHRHVVRTRYEKECVECAQPFTARRVDARYCSGTCHRIAWERDNKERIREQKRDYQRANRARIREADRAWRQENAEQQAERKRLRADAERADPERAAARRARNHAYYLANREKILEQKRQSATGTAERSRSAHGVEWAALFEGLWEAQAGLCYLCKQPLDRDASRQVHLDHDHRCCPLGRSCERCRRGLACKSCNLIIGLAQDNPERLRQIAEALALAAESVTLRMQVPRLPRNAPSYEFRCRECSGTFTASRRDATYCSAPCYEKARHRERRANLEHAKTCQFCGRDFTGASWARYCSTFCAQQAGRARKGMRFRLTPAGSAPGISHPTLFP